MPTRTHTTTAAAATSVAAVVLAVGVGGVLGVGSSQGSGAGRDDTANVFVATGSTSNNGDPKCQGAQNSSCVGKISVVKVGGGSERLYPSTSITVPVLVSNPNNFDVAIVSVQLDAVGDGSKTASSTCSQAVNLSWPRTARSISPNIKVKAGQQVTVQTSPIAMRANADESCKGVSFPVTVTVTAVK